MSTATMTPRQFCTKHGISATAEQTLTNPHMDSDGWQATHYKVTLRRTDPATGKRRQLTTYFSQGLAHTSPPKAHSVLSCLAMDAASVSNGESFDDWAGNLGYDPDSRKAERIYLAIQQQSSALQQFLGDEAYEQALWEMDSD